MRAHIADMLDDVHTCKVASIVSYNATLQKASCQPLVHNKYVDQDTGEIKTERPPVIDSVPIAFPRLGQWGMTFPVQRGDVVLLVFGDSSLDRWLQRGGEIDPEDDRRHDYNDAIAIPGVFDFAHVPTSAPTDALVIHGPKVRLADADADDKVALHSALVALKGAINSWTPVPNDGGAALKTILTNLFTTGAGWPISASKVFAKP